MFQELILRWFGYAPVKYYTKLRQEYSKLEKEKRELEKKYAKDVEASRNLIERYSDQVDMLEETLRLQDTSGLFNYVEKLEVELERVIPQPEWITESKRGYDEYQTEVFTYSWEIPRHYVQYTTPKVRGSDEVIYHFLRRFRTEVVPKLELELQEKIKEMFKHE